MVDPRGTAREGRGSERADRAGIAAEAVRAQLARILASRSFDATERNQRFLRHVVEETLAGRDGRIKAYSNGVAVFGRDDSFDPQSDPIVRIEASGLRRSLEHYYLLDGKHDPIRIEIPKGGLRAGVPSPRGRRDAAAPAAADTLTAMAAFGGAVLGAPPALGLGPSRRDRSRLAGVGPCRLAIARGPARAGCRPGVRRRREMSPGRRDRFLASKKGRPS